MADTRARERPMSIRTTWYKDKGLSIRRSCQRGRGKKISWRGGRGQSLAHDREVLAVYTEHTELTVARSRIHKQRQVRVQKREQRVKRRNAGGTASTHHAACSRPLHKRPCRLAARANERFYNSMQSPPEGPFGLSFSLSLILRFPSFAYSLPPSLSLLPSTTRALLRPRRMFSPLREDQLQLCIYARVHHSPLHSSLPNGRSSIYILAKCSLSASLDVRCLS